MRHPLWIPLSVTLIWALACGGGSEAPTAEATKSAPDAVQQQAAPAAQDLTVEVALSSEVKKDDPGEMPYTTFTLTLKGADGAVVKSEKFGPLDGGGSVSSTAEGSLATWYLWWAGAGWNVKLVQQGDALVLLKQGIGEGMDNPDAAPWEEMGKVALNGQKVTYREVTH